MTIIRSAAKTAILGIIFQSIVLFAENTCRAQSVSLSQDKDLSSKFEHASDDVFALADTAQFSSAGPALADPPHSTTAGEDSEWHSDASPYIWLPGVHGTVGALGRDSSVHATPGDLISNFRFGLMGTVEARRKWLLLPLDMMWVRLGDSKALPFPNLEATNADIKADEFILTPKVGIRLLNQEKIKIDVLTGIRYWHFSENVHFVPSNLNLNFTASQDWVDPLLGGRITGVLAPKIVITIFGDVGGWGTGSQLDYQFGGVLGYKIKPKWTLQAGYRYLFADYRNGGTAIEMVTSGVLMGITFNIK
jgi:hypothetical protein